MPAQKRYLDPEVLARLTGLELKARLVVEGFLSGLHSSPFKGFSQEFADYRPYQPGDELRRIDWRVYGRRDRYYIKEYQDETNLRAYILLDKSGSMAYGRRINKLEYAKYLGASLAYLFFKQKDAVGFATFDTEIRELNLASSKRVNLMNILEVLERTRPGAETALGRILFQLGQKLKRRGLVILLSDLLDEPAEVIRSLVSFRARKHEVLVFQILDPDEAEFPFDQPAIFCDLERDERVIVQPAMIAKSYKEKFARLLEQYRRRFLEAAIDYQVLYTNQAYDRALFFLLQKRMRLM